MNGTETSLNLTQWLVRRAIWLSVFLSSCGGEDKKQTTQSADGGSTTTVISASNGESRQPLVKIPIGFAEAFASKTTLALTAAVPTYEILVTGCLSGYSATVTQSNTDGLEVYRYDRSCIAKLSQFTLNAKTYVPTAASPFTTWQTGDTAIFDEDGAPGIVPLQLIVLSTIGNPVTGAETIQYGIRSNLNGGTKAGILFTSADAGTKKEVAANATPSFGVKSIEFVSFSASEAGQFSFVMECSATIGISSSCATVPFADIDYILVEDTFSDPPGAAELDVLFSEKTPSTIAGGDRVAPGSLGTANGGFQTITLTGPIPLASRPNMLLVLRSYAASYQYFNVDVATTPSS